MSAFTPYPLHFKPLLKPRVWGGHRLEQLGKDLPEDEAIGESWEIADLPESVDDGRSVVENGQLAGRTLREVLAEHGKAVMGDARCAPDGAFPLLIKFLDAADNLSVQVHPTADYAETHPGAHVKSEAWFVIEAEPDSVIYLGVKPEVSRKDFEAHVRSGDVVDDLVAVPAAPGRCYSLPSGTCHALGAGVLVAEVQTPSDTTFRVFDWGRTGRELHPDEALACIRYGEPERGPEEPGALLQVGGMRAQRLLKSDEFTIERIDSAGAAVLPIVTNDMPEVWMFIKGGGAFETADRGETLFEAGRTTLIPAGLKDATVRLNPATELLRITLPSALDGAIA